jgi:pimeloyl-ACP methyl ester carboxylesterase
MEMSLNIFEYGSKDGVPVVLFFGTPERGSAGAELDMHASSHNLRLICPTRPWYDDQSASPSFDVVTKPVLDYLQKQGVTSAHVVGGSGGGPFALHLAIQDEQTIIDCTLLASAGLPDSFVKHVTSTPTLELLKAFENRDYANWIETCAKWGLPSDLAHGAWGDFITLFDELPKMNRKTNKPVYVYQSKTDPNAPLESVQDMLTEASNVEWYIDESACHIAMAKDKTGKVVDQIFASIQKRACMA